MSNKFQNVIDKVRQKCYLTRLKFRGYKVSHLKNITKSNRTVNVVIPCIDKDAKLLPIVIFSVRKFLNHPINSINIIAPQASSYIKDICLQYGCNFINEEDVLDRGVIKSGWYYQQFIKWAWTDFMPDYDYITLDADTIFLKDFSYDKNNRIVLEYDASHYKPYWNLIKSIGLNLESSLGFVCHHMLWKREWLRELKNQIETKNNCNWMNAIKRYVDITEDVKFSEFQTYGNFLLGYHKNDIILEDWMNTTQQFKKEYDLTSPEKTLDLLIKRFKNNKSVTFPSWYQNNYDIINNM